MLHQLFTAEFWAVLAGCWSVLSTFAAYRMRRWLTAHLERERALDVERTTREFERHNETLRILSQASANTERPTLNSLLEDVKQDFELESSEPRSLDWTDDNDPTSPGTPQALQNEIEMSKKTKPKPRPKGKGY